jgi:hypothetical protein
LETEPPSSLGWYAPPALNPSCRATILEQSRFLDHGRLRWPPTDIEITGSGIVLSTTSAHFRKKLMDNVTLIRDVSHPIPLESASPRRLTGILQDAGFTFDAVKRRLGTEYRQWSPKGAGVAGKFRAFVECAGMRADIGARMLFGPAGSGILDTIAGYF